MKEKSKIQTLLADEYSIVCKGNHFGTLLAVGRCPGSVPLAEQVSRRVNLAGLEMDHRTRVSSTLGRVLQLAIITTDPVDSYQVKDLPSAKFSSFRWSPDGRYLAMLAEQGPCGSLWVHDFAGKCSRQIISPVIAPLGKGFYWAPDSRSLIVRVPANSGHFRRRPTVRYQPSVFEATGVAKPLRTFRNLLTTPEEIRRLDFCICSQLVAVALDGTTSPLTENGPIIGFSPSPDGQWLHVLTAPQPWPSHVPLSRFPLKREILSLGSGRNVFSVVLNTADTLTVSHDTVRPGLRNAWWIGHRQGLMALLEAEDNGDGLSHAEWRDRLDIVDFSNGQVSSQIRFAGRVQKVVSVNQEVVLVSELWRRSRIARNWLVRIDNGDKQLLHEYPQDNRKRSPGTILIRDNGLFTSAGNGDEEVSNTIYFTGMRQNMTGETPVLNRVDLANGVTERIWESPHERYMVPLLPPDSSGRLLVRDESPSDPPNLSVVFTRTGDRTSLTTWKSTWSSVGRIKRQILYYQREDGVQLSAMLYLPPQKSVGKIPLLVWAYPKELISQDASADLRTSENRFLFGNGVSAVTLAALGFAVLDRTAMPIIEDRERTGTNTFIEQCAMNARAAIIAAEATGKIDTTRVAIGGRSYGAFMAMNLVAHTSLFQAAIACSGAYNRTLTPFGFQYEERHLWQVPEVYQRVSPFLHADKINTPVLLIHGDEDPNAGTHPLQSKRMFDALCGLGKIARLVMLPNEGHFYRSLEGASVAVQEMSDWLKRYL